MSSRFGLLRLDYTYSVILPMLIAIYFNKLNPFLHIDILAGFFFLAITGNTWNDVIDMKDPNEVETLKRVEGYHPKEIFTIGFVSLILGISLLLRTCLEHSINAILLIIIIAMVLLYCKWLKPIPFINQILLATSHILLPYFMIKIDAGIALINTLGELFLLLAFLTFAITGQFIHEIIDSDAIAKHFNLKQCRLIVLFSSLISFILGIWAFILIQHYYFLVFIFTV